MCMVTLQDVVQRFLNLQDFYVFLLLLESISRSCVLTGCHHFGMCWGIFGLNGLSASHDNFFFYETEPDWANTQKKRKMKNVVSMV